MTRPAPKRLLPIAVGVAGLTLSLAFMAPSFADDAPPPASPGNSGTSAPGDPNWNVVPTKKPKLPVVVDHGNGACADCVTGENT